MTGNLDIEVTYATILAATRNGEVTGYEKIAEARGRYLGEGSNELFSHLGDILRVCFKRGWPALTVIVVNKKTRAMTGYAPEKLDPKDKEIRRLPIGTVGYKDEWEPFQIGAV